MVAKTVIDVILGEAGGKTRAERYADALAIASVIQNRADVLGTTPEDVVSVESEFNAYGKPLPPGTESLREIAEQAWNDVQTHGPINGATFYATEKAAKNLPSGLKQVHSQGEHKFYTDPKGRSIRTAQGLITPSTDNQPAMIAANLVPIDNPYAGLVPPNQVPSVALPQNAPPPASRPTPSRTITPGAGLANLTPNGLRAAPDMSGLAGKGRGAAPSGDLLGIIDGSVKSVLGNDWTIAVSSGTYSPEKQAQLAALENSIVARGGNPNRGWGKQAMRAAGQIGSTRHNYSDAADFSVINTRTGQTLQRGVHDAQLQDVAREAAARGIKGVGFSKGYMDADGVTRFHMDTVSDMVWGDRGRAVNADPAVKAAVESAKATGVGALPNFYTPGGIPTPTARPETMAAPVDVVERGSLPSLPEQAKIDAYTAYGRSRMAPGARPATMAASAAPMAGAGVQGTGTLSIAPPPAMPPIDTMTTQQAADVANASRGRRGPNFAGTDPASMAAPMADNTPVPSGFPAPPPAAGFPAPPPAPGRQARKDAAMGAAGGFLTGGPIGAVLGGLLGPARAQIAGNIRSNRQGRGRVGLLNGIRDAYRGFGGMFGNMGGLLSPPTYASPYSVGSGYGAIGSTFGGPPGATAYSRSNPAISFTSLGNGLVSRTNKDTGVSYTMSPGDYNAGNNRSGKSGKK